jgi:hypothetical protein
MSCFSLNTISGNIFGFDLPIPCTAVILNAHKAINIPFEGHNNEVNHHKSYFFSKHICLCGFSIDLQ